MNPQLSAVVTALPEDVAGETQYSSLNKLGFVRGVTAQHQWFLLVNDAVTASSLPRNEMVRDYLAFMLFRFMERAELLSQLDAFSYYEYFFGKKKPGETSVQDIADMSLQFVALFPEQSQNRHQPRSLDYVAGLGVDLYRDLSRDSKGRDDWFSHAYRVMADSFGYAVMILRSVCPRFAPYQTPPESGKYIGNWYIPSDSEAKKIRNTAEQLNLMHFEIEHMGGSRNN